MKIAIQGELGSFHHIASVAFYGDGHTYVSGDTFDAVFARLQDKTADVAVVAIENSLFGSIPAVYDLLLKHGYPIVGEISERIHQNLISYPGVSLADISSVYSHPIALAQCANFLDDRLPYAERLEHHDTAAAVAYIKEKNLRISAAIASSKAADMHGMHIIAEKIEDEELNYTRFLVIDPVATTPPGANKASLVLTTTHEPGALYAALGVFAEAGCNLTKLQSRPIIGKVWKYQFFIDVEVSPDTLKEVTQKLQSAGCKVINLGCYKSFSGLNL